MLLGEPDKVLPDFIKSNNIGGLVTDFTPLRKPMKWLDDVSIKLPKNVPVCQVCPEHQLQHSRVDIQSELYCVLYINVSG